MGYLTKAHAHILLLIFATLDFDVYQVSGSRFVSKATAIIGASSPSAGCKRSPHGVVTLLTWGGKSTLIAGQIRGLNPGGQHGWHVHDLGNLEDGCNSLGPHYNPLNKTHGAPQANVRHVGDMGNLVADRFGVATFRIKDDQIKLNGPESVIGRGLVIHEKADDLGRGGNRASLDNGNSGPRIACGIIGIKEEIEDVEDCPIPKDELSTYGWGVLHTVAANYPDRPNEQEQEDMKEFIRLFAKLYPCPSCLKALSILPFSTTFSSGDELSLWLCNRHSQANLLAKLEPSNCPRVTSFWRQGWKSQKCQEVEIDPDQLLGIDQVFKQEKQNKAAARRLAFSQVL